MLTKLILLSPNDYEQIKKECYKDQQSSEQKIHVRKPSESELLKEWYAIRQRSLEQSIQNRKHMRDIDIEPKPAKQSNQAETQTMPIKMSHNGGYESTHNDGFNSPPPIFSSSSSNNETEEEEEPLQNINTTPRQIKKELFTNKFLDRADIYDPRDIQSKLEESLSRRRGARKRSHDITRDFGKGDTPNIKNSERRPVERKKRKQKEYIANSEKKRSLRERKQKGNGSAQQTFKFIKKWVSI